VVGRARKLHNRDYLTAGGHKISKSGGAINGKQSVDPLALAGRYGTDAVRWWLLREVPRTGDADFTEDRLVARANDELANGIGNLVNRVVSMVHRYCDGVVPDVRTPAPGADALTDAITAAPDRIDAALDDLDFRSATEAVWNIADEANRYINDVRPWSQACHSRDQVLTVLVRACRAIGEHLRPFLPDAAARITAQCPAGNRLPEPSPVFERLHAEPEHIIGKKF
jgi:methionyl-tRNA synthetase